MKIQESTTRELAICLTASAEKQLQNDAFLLCIPERAAIREALEAPFRYFKNGNSVMRFWNWADGKDTDHPLVGFLMGLTKVLPPCEHFYLRIRNDDVLERSGYPDRFYTFGVSTIPAPRITIGSPRQDLSLDGEEHAMEAAGFRQRRMNFSFSTKRFSQEPTRELAICLTAPCEAFLQKYLRRKAIKDANAIREAIRQPLRIKYDNGSVMRFWSWDICNDAEHPVVGLLIETIRNLPPEGYWFVRIVADDNVIEEAGSKDAFASFGIKTVHTPRIVF